MLVQEIIEAFGGVSVADTVIILAACKITAIFVKDAGKKLGLFDETLEAGSDELAEFVNKNSTRIMTQSPHARRLTAMTKDLLIIGAVVALVAIMVLAALPR